MIQDVGFSLAQGESAKGPLLLSSRVESNLTVKLFDFGRKTKAHILSHRQLVNGDRLYIKKIQPQITTITIYIDREKIERKKTQIGIEWGKERKGKKERNVQGCEAR